VTGSNVHLDMTNDIITIVSQQRETRRL